MERLIIILLVCVFISCADNCEDNLAIRKVDLKNGLGQLSLLVSKKFDTTYAWTNNADNLCDDREMIRFANKKYTLLNETGFFYNKPVDSLFQITISQAKDSTCKNNKIDVNALLKQTKELSNILNSNILSESKIRSINDRNYVVSTSVTPVNSFFNATIKATTIIDGQRVIISYTCYGKGCKYFIDSMESSLNSIKIK